MTPLVRRLALVALFVLVLASAGCERTLDLYCRQFPDTETCCPRRGGVWNPTTRTCDIIFLGS